MNDTEPRTVLTSIYVDPDKWERFTQVAKQANQSRSAQLREYIDRALEEHDTAKAPE